MTPVVRTALLTAGTAGGASLATAMFLASKGGDITALIGQVNVVVKDVTTLVAMAVPLITGGYAVWRAASTKAKIQDVESDKKIEHVIVNDPQLANDLGPKVVTQLPAIAQAKVGAA